MRWNEKNRTGLLPVGALTLMAASEPLLGAAAGTEYDAGAVLHRLLRARVVVSVLVAFTFVGAVVAAGALFRDRDDRGPAHRHVPTTASPSPSTSSTRP